MKKLFFTALVAIVAVGGALTSHAQVVEGEDTHTIYDCTSPTGNLCSEIDENVITPDQGTQNPANYFLLGERYL